MRLLRLAPGTAGRVAGHGLSIFATVYRPRGAQDEKRTEIWHIATRLS